MGSVIPLKKEVDNSYLELVNLVGNKLNDVNQQIKYKLASEINLIHKMTSYHLKSGGKKIRPLLTLSSAKLCGYENGIRDVNLAACVELIHNATLLHDDVIDNSNLRRGIKTSNTIWGNKSSILVGDYLLSRCFEMMVEDGSPEILKLLSSTSSKIAQGEISQLEYKGEIDILEETYFDHWARNGNSILRPIHYPPITQEPDGAVRAGAHGDINLITLLMGASTGGLQVLRKDGKWIDAIPEEDELVINVGDMLERHTNNKLRSTIHRVINPPKEEWENPRYSIPFFMHPRSEMKLDCLDECVSPENPKQYEDITAGEFLHQRLVEIGLIKK